MKTEAEIKMKIRALQDIENSGKENDIVSKSILAGEIEALQWVLAQSKGS